jgi:hypothetical protein
MACPCLRLVPPSACPSASEGVELPNCDDVVLPLGALCEGDGECGTLKTVNNCNGNQDIYERCAYVYQASEPPRAPPAAPSLPPAPAFPPPPPLYCAAARTRDSQRGTELVL